MSWKPLGNTDPPKEGVTIPRDPGSPQKLKSRVSRFLLAAASADYLRSEEVTGEWKAL
jgi:hypothetical protein